MTAASGQSPSRRTRYPLVVLSLLFILAAAWCGGYLLAAAPSSPEATVTVTIPKGSSVKSIAAILADASLVGDKYSFFLLVKLSHLARRLPAGEFALRGGQRPLALLTELVAAKSLTHAITLPEGLTAAEMAELFAKGGWCDKKEYLQLVTDPAFIAKLNFAGLPGLEGYLYPDTYHLTKDDGAANVITMQTRRFKEVWKALGGERLDEAARRRTVILASLVEKEAAIAAERPLIAGVFANRLRLGMPLQSDPTVLYGVTSQTRPITRTDLERSTPYNTYVIAGLPAGPIANPGRESLSAALAPAKTDFLYFVAKNDGSHQFSTTLAAHNSAVQQYQRSGK
jgi:UPF0755 protein